MTKTAVVLFNLGGPNNQAAIKPFLFNLFNDRAIINLPQPLRFLLAKLISNKRQKTANEIYKLIGSKSPILEITSSQAMELERKLLPFGDFKVFVSMRYWHPFLKEIKPNILKYAPDKIILLPLYPQFSTATTLSSFKEFEKIFPKKELKFRKIAVKHICCYPLQDEFISSHANLIIQTIAKSGHQDDKNFLQNTRILFSAHGLPQKIIDNGDPYVLQVQATSDKVVERMRVLLNGAKIDYQLCFQSKVGPLKWTTPSLQDELERAAQDKKLVMVVPIAFVSDHSETLVELDIEYKEMAQHLGIECYLRVPALNIDDNFINSLVNLCKTAKDSSKLCVGGGICLPNSQCFLKNA